MAQQMHPMTHDALEMAHCLQFSVSVDFFKARPRSFSNLNRMLINVVFTTKVPVP